VRCAARECLRSFRLTSGVERRRSGGLAGRALARAQRHGIASRRRGGLNSAVLQARFGCQKLRPRSVDVLPLGRRGQQRTLVRCRDSWVRAVMPVRRDMRASVRGVPQKQQERRGKRAYQGTIGRHRHVSGCALTNCSNVGGSAATIKRQLTPQLGFNDRYHAAMPFGRTGHSRDVIQSTFGEVTRAQWPPHSRRGSRLRTNTSTTPGIAGVIGLV